MEPMVFIRPFITFNQYQMGLILPQGNSTISKYSKKETDSSDLIDF